MFDILLPVIMLIATGWAFTHFNLIDGKTVEAGLNQFLFMIALPAIIFLSIATMSLQLGEAIKYMLSYTVVVAVTFFISYFFCIKTFSLNKLEANFASLSASVSNAALIGLPVLIGLYGVKASIPVALTLVIFILIVMPVFTFTIEYLLNKHHASMLDSSKIAVMKTIKNPLVIAAVLGLVVHMMNINLPKAITNYFQYLSDTTAACALVVVGIGLKYVSAKEDLAETLTMTGFNLILKPILAIAAAWIFNLDSFYAISLLVACSVPTSKTLYIISKQYQLYESEMASIIFSTSVISIITFPIFLSMAMYLWPS